MQGLRGNYVRPLTYSFRLASKNASSSCSHAVPSRGKKRFYSDFLEQYRQPEVEQPPFNPSNDSKTNTQNKDDHGVLKKQASVKSDVSLFRTQSSRKPKQNAELSKGLRDTFPKTKLSRRKRHASPPSAQTNSSDKPHLNDSQVLKDEHYMRKNHVVPTAEDYPDAPKSLFKSPALQRVHMLVARLPEVHLDVTTDHKAPNSCRRTIIKLTSKEHGELEAIGEGRNKPNANQAAGILMLSMLHQNGFLAEIYSNEPTLESEQISEESNAKEEVYNYAASSTLLPIFTYRVISRPFRAKRNEIMEVGITLKEQGIDVVARGTTTRIAEITAALKFKEKAESYQKEHGDGTINVNDSKSLNTGNVGNFYSFLRVHSPKTKITVTSRPSRSTLKTEGKIWESQAMLDEKSIGPPILMSSKKRSEIIAQMVAAVILIQQKPTLQDEFKKALHKVSRTGEILTPIAPINVDIDSDATLIMEQTLHEVRKAGLKDEKKAVEAEVESEILSRRYERRKLTVDEISWKNKRLKQYQEVLQKNRNYQDLREKILSLPMSQHHKEVLNLINNHTYSVIVGATGSGKTTQVPRIIFEDAIQNDWGAQCNVICTQPRRIAATSVARRVARERNEELGNSVGHVVRFDTQRPKEGGSITYCTTGILLRELQDFPDEVLDNTSHIIIDEVHERDTFIDFLMIVLKNCLEIRRIQGKSLPKVVLMSATIDSDLFANYFRNIGRNGYLIPCPSLFVPGRTFPVQEKYLNDIVHEMKQTYGDSLSDILRSDDVTYDYLKSEIANFSPESRQEKPHESSIEGLIDWKGERVLETDPQNVTSKEEAMVPIALISATIAHICETTPSGAILVFLPGYVEMDKVANFLRDQKPLSLDFTDLSKYKLSMLHSSVPALEQQEVFNDLPPGCRRIILSTNIAETSVTIPEVQHVVDSGKLREKQYDQVRRISGLTTKWVSKSNVKQRGGRAGRVQHGTYYALYSRERYTSFRATGLPEMLRSDLQEVCLDVMAQTHTMPVREFLAKAIEPPSPLAIELSLKELKSLEAITPNEQLTSLGRLLARLPIHPSLGKMVVLGIIFRCLDPMIILGAVHAEKDLFLRPLEKRQEALALHQRFIEGTSSDHYAIINAFSQIRKIDLNGARGDLARFCFNNFLHNGAYKSIYGTAHQIEEILIEAGLIPTESAIERRQFGIDSLNINSYNEALIKALVVGGLHPNIAVCQGFTFRSAGESRVMIHPSSVNYSTSSQRHQQAPSNDRYMYDEDPTKSYGSLLAYSVMAGGVGGDRTFLKCTSHVTPLMAILFGGHLRANSNSDGKILQMDRWLPLRLRTEFRNVKIVVEFRKALDRILTASFEDLALFREKVSASKDRSGNLDGSYSNDHTSNDQISLADDIIRDTFANGVVDVLDRDMYQPRKRRLKQ